MRTRLNVDSSGLKKHPIHLYEKQECPLQPKKAGQKMSGFFYKNAAQLLSNDFFHRHLRTLTDFKNVNPLNQNLRRNNGFSRIRLRRKE